MTALENVRGRDDSIQVGNALSPNLEKRISDTEENVNVPTKDSSDDKREVSSLDRESLDSDAHFGTQKMEALAQVWPKKVVYATYAWIWVCFFMLALHSSIGSNVIFNAYANFESAPQVATASILSTIIGGVMKLVTARLITIWGRAEGFIVFVSLFLVGIIVTASCTGPDGYAAGYTLYWVGYNAIYLMLDVFIADTSGLKNRAFAFGFATTPFICTAFTGPLAATSFLNHSTWRWAYGAFAIIFPVVFAPLIIVFKFYERKAYKLGIIQKRNSGRKWYQSLLYYIIEFDVVGAFILMAAFILFLLPFSLQTNGRATYKSATFIVMLIIGILLFPVFAIWEKYWARQHFIRWELFKKRTVLGACLAAMFVNFSFMCWDQFYYTFVIVVYNLSTTNAGYMLQIYNVGSCFWSPIVGIVIRLLKHWKYLVLGFGVPMMILGAGLMIHFRGDDHSIGYLIMTQIFIAFGGGTMVIGYDMAVMASSDLDGVPMMLSLIGLFSSVGLAIGSAVASAVNSNIFPEALRDALPEANKADYYEIYYGGYLTQMSYPVGSEIRNAIIKAWSESQKNMSIAATCVLIGLIPSVLIWKNYSTEKKQNVGTVM